MSDIRPRTISWLVRQISGRLDTDPVLHNVVLEAEVSNFHAHSSGHWYFSLKDERSRIDATMWENDNLLVSFMPKDGDKIRVLGSVTMYQAQGKVQFTVRKMARAGEGDLKARFDALYRKLDEEGLFAQEHKLPIPAYPMRIGLVTGNMTHARADVYNTLGRRWPIAEVREYNVLVQGEAAPPEIIRALKAADIAGHDVILLCRGGGSAEDLWCFNDELLARTIYAMHTPLITGVGHEPDWTMVDYVADLRAPTPTGAAERATPDIRQVNAFIQDTGRVLRQLMDKRLAQEKETLASLSGSRVFTDPFTLVKERYMEKDLLEERFYRLLHAGSFDARQKVNEQKQALYHAVKVQLSENRHGLQMKQADLLRETARAAELHRSKLAAAAGLLDAYSPLKVLERGYSIVTKKEEAVHSAASLHVDDTISIRFHEGNAQALVTDITLKEKMHG